MKDGNVEEGEKKREGFVLSLIPIQRRLRRAVRGYRLVNTWRIERFIPCFTCTVSLNILTPQRRASSSVKQRPASSTVKQRQAPSSIKRQAMSSVKQSLASSNGLPEPPVSSI